MCWTYVWNSWLCCTYQLHRVNQWTSAGSWGDRWWDAKDRKHWCCVMCMFIYTHKKTLCCILLCCTLIYTHTTSRCVDCHCVATPVNRLSTRHPETPDTWWSDELCSWWSWIRSSASPCLYNMPLCQCGTASTSASLDLTSHVDPFLMDDANKFSRDLRECNLSCNINWVFCTES